MNSFYCIIIRGAFIGIVANLMLLSLDFPTFQNPLATLYPFFTKPPADKSVDFLDSHKHKVGLALDRHTSLPHTFLSQ